MFLTLAFTLFIFSTSVLGQVNEVECPDADTPPLLGQVDEVECPDADNPPCAEKFYSHPYTCHQYFQCTRGCVVYLFNCSTEDLHFNPDIGACMLPENYPCEDTPFPEPAVFFGAKNQNQILRQDPVELDVEISDRLNSLDPATSRFTAHTAGTYFFTMSLGAIDGRRTSFNMASGSSYIEEVGVSRTSNDHNGADTTSRDVIRAMSVDDTVSMLSEGGLYSDSNFQTSLGGFSLHDTMRYQDAFSVARTSAFSTIGTITYDNLILNEGLHFDMNAGTFTAPRAGLYFFSFSVGISGTATTKVQLQVNGAGRGQIYRNHANYDGLDTLSRSLMLELNEGNVVQLQLLEGAIESTSLSETCFNGFLYLPVSPDTDHPMATHAWSVHRTTSYTAADTSVLSFDEVDVNEGSLYDTTSDTVTTTQSGYYFVHVNAGAQPNIPVDMRIVKVNTGEVLANLLRKSTVHSGVDTLGRSAIVHLNAGDAIQVQVLALTGVFSDAYRETSFTGFFIFNK